MSRIGDFPNESGAPGETRTSDPLLRIDVTRGDYLLKADFLLLMSSLKFFEFLRANNSSRSRGFYFSPSFISSSSRIACSLGVIQES